MFSVRVYERTEIVNHLLSVANTILSSPLPPTAKAKSITALVESAAHQLNSFFNPRQALYKEILDQYLFHWVKKFEKINLRFTPIEEIDAVIANGRMVEEIERTFQTDKIMRFLSHVADVHPSVIITEKYQHGLFDYEDKQVMQRCTEAEKYESDISHAWSGSGGGFM